jgi:signal transduction histidine kinase
MRTTSRTGPPRAWSPRGARRSLHSGTATGSGGPAMKARTTRGIFPSLLADKGLVAALESQARKAAVPTTVDSDGIGRSAQETEAAVCFCTLEVLQNVSKSAKASRAGVRLADGDGRLTSEVTDDGEGFDPAKTGYSTGLQGMADWLAAEGGEFEVPSERSGGTTALCGLPIEEMRR